MGFGAPFKEKPHGSSRRFCGRQIGSASFSEVGECDAMLALTAERPQISGRAA
jgi:hypothetical protein